MKPHSLRGTPGAMPVAELHREPTDEVLPKRRFSAFFKTDLDQTLRTQGVDTVAVCGISTHFCVITTALDAVCHDFRTIIVEDGTAAYSAATHDECLALYRRNPLYPLLRKLLPRYVTNSEDLGRAMIRVADAGYHRNLIEGHDINALAALPALTPGGGAGKSKS